jgi:Raf kinase inhibitor-like YbhB/YbcL family protein
MLSSHTGILSWIFVLGCGVACAGCNPKTQGGTAGGDPGKALGALTVSSGAFGDGEPIPAKYACNTPQKDACDLGLSPPLSWTAGPAQTQSYAIVVCDPEGHDWLHWIVSNIPASTTSLSEGASGHCKSQLPSGATDGKNEFGQIGYGVPCPPAGSGVHHYIFTVYALPTATIALPASAKCAELKAVLDSQAIARGAVTGTYRIDR